MLQIELASGEDVANVQPNIDEILKCPGRGLVITGPAPSGSEFDFFSRFFCPKLAVNEVIRHDSCMKRSLRWDILEYVLLVVQFICPLRSLFAQKMQPAHILCINRCHVRVLNITCSGWLVHKAI